MVTVAIQAGGESRRMGRDKGLVRLGEKTLVEQVYTRVRELGDEVLLITPRPADYAFLNLHLVSDATPGLGPLAGLLTALQAAHNPAVLVVACDMPLLSRPLLQHLLSLSPHADVVVPRWRGEFEPLHAVYARSCLPAVEAAVAAGQTRVVSFFPEVRVRIVDDSEIAIHDPTGSSFFNVNSPADLVEAGRRLEQQDPP
jgi:molybdopterin-guanine dinucleotide biosynthesis protein A